MATAATLLSAAACLVPLGEAAVAARAVAQALMAGLRSRTAAFSATVRCFCKCLRRGLRVVLGGAYLVVAPRGWRHRHLLLPARLRLF